MKIIEAGAVDLQGNGYYSVVAETASGSRFILAGYAHRNADRVAALAAKVQAFGKINADLWLDHHPRYGSEAYEAESAEAHMYADGLRSGMIGEGDVPDNIRTLL
jgi:hypothetical protein